MITDNQPDWFAVMMSKVWWQAHTVRQIKRLFLNQQIVPVPNIRVPNPKHARNAEPVS